MTAQQPPVPRLGARLRALINEYPSQFWLVIGAMFIDRLGGALLFPFFALYLTKKFDISMTQVGVIFGIFAIASVFGNFIGGALTDRMGRKRIIIFGLVASASASILMGVINELTLFMGVVLVVGVLSDVAGPAHQSLIADLLPEEKRSQGFALLRIVANLATTIGPIIGGFLAAKSYLSLFITDAITSTMTAAILFFALKETFHRPAEGQPQENLAQTFQGYRHVLHDSIYMFFLFATILSVLVYQQMSTTLPVYLRDFHGVVEQQYGYILSLNATLVVLMQFSISRWVSKYRPLLVITIGIVLYALGFAMYGFVQTYPLFLVAMVVITLGEMLAAPTSQAVVARLAPEEMRGRYMAAFNFSWLLPTALGPLLAGLVMDNLNPDWVWYAAGIVGMLSAAAYFGLDRHIHRTSYRHIDRRLKVIEAVENGEISAVSAGIMLEKLQLGSWAQVADFPPSAQQPAVHFKIYSAGSSTPTHEFAIPTALIRTVQNSGGSLAPELSGYSPTELDSLLQTALTDHAALSARLGSDQIELWVD